MENLLKKGGDDGGEPLTDAAGDLGVYGLMGLMTLWGWWPGVPAQQESPRV